MEILAIDPGPEHSGFVIMSVTDTVKVLDAESEIENTDLLKEPALKDQAKALVIEWVANYGNIVGDSLFRTAYWAGRFDQAHIGVPPDPAARITRRDAAQILVGKSSVKDSVLHGRCREIVSIINGVDERSLKGTKGSPGPLYGVTGHAWSALAVGLAWAWCKGLDDVYVEALQKRQNA